MQIFVLKKKERNKMNCNNETYVELLQQWWYWINWKLKEVICITISLFHLELGIEINVKNFLRKFMEFVEFVNELQHTLH